MTTLVVLLTISTQQARGGSLIHMKLRIVLALLVAASLQACAVYVPPVQVGGLVLVPGDEHHEHHERHHRGHDRDDD